MNEINNSNGKIYFVPIDRKVMLMRGPLRRRLKQNAEQPVSYARADGSRRWLLIPARHLHKSPRDAELDLAMLLLNADSVEWKTMP